MSKKTDQAGADAADDISSLFAKLGSQGASAYQDFSGARLSAPEPAVAEALPPAEAPQPIAPVSVPTLSVVRAPAESRPVVALPVAKPAAAEPAASAAAAAATPLAQLFQRLLETGRDRVPTPDSPLKRLQIR
ncbi:hypothetical protein QSH18_05845 [Xanthomonas sp. NCPPB 2654]|uniref:hypothetical protein n=1 Tax=unclassified Xanthomonas TaxID=2643310 RepID=UPI0021E0C11F|nr:MULTISPECIES: hypothetical protein [unclassified Xanthomonas]MDL5365121.1 hypothetical protein [Xanthomonas sp. NCPPB 2654]MEB1530332.1 hypothetical protein [Xanthomonas campestris pv. campestris]UYC21544.1 hypothetical protein NUG20_04330 [Xanthomonas sp. CFBP 8443]